MIQSKEDLKQYLQADKQALGITWKRPRAYLDDPWRFEILLRKHEYYHNVPGFLHKFLCKIYALLQYKLGSKLGFFVPINVCDMGLHINHTGLLIINPNAKIGKNLDVHQGVNIGQNVDSDKAPVIGNDVFIGPGAKLMGDITIGDRVAIGAGAVVTHSFEQSDITIAGVPAKVISNHGNPFLN